LKQDIETLVDAAGRRMMTEPVALPGAVTNALRQRRRVIVVRRAGAVAGVCAVAAIAMVSLRSGLSEPHRTEIGAGTAPPIVSRPVQQLSPTVANYSAAARDGMAAVDTALRRVEHSQAQPVAEDAAMRPMEAREMLMPR
jgi:hypothetical protein